MKNKICFITGSTDGIGKSAAMHLAAKGAVVILNGKSKVKGEKVVEEIKQTMFNKNIFYEQCDLSDFDEVKDLARRISKNYPKIDVLINNAGIFSDKYKENKDGIEMHFAVNHLSHFILTNFLMEQLNDNARIINVSSDMHRKGSINFNDLNLKEKFNGIEAYRQSKLANILFTYELARRLEENGKLITVNALHPGVVKTDIGSKNTSKLMNIISKLMAPFLLEIDKGAETSIYLATNSEVEQVTSKYFIKKMAVQSSPESYNFQTAMRLWNVSMVLVNKYL